MVRELTRTDFLRLVGISTLAMSVPSCVRVGLDRLTQEPPEKQESKIYKVGPHTILPVRYLTFHNEVDYTVFLNIPTLERLSEEYRFDLYSSETMNVRLLPNDKLDDPLEGTNFLQVKKADNIELDIALGPTVKKIMNDKGRAPSDFMDELFLSDIASGAIFVGYNQIAFLDGKMDKEQLGKNTVEYLGSLLDQNQFISWVSISGKSPYYIDSESA
jgi:hypothetical protein